MDRTNSIVVVTRDPDASNDYAEFGLPVLTHDIDLGYADLSDEEEFGEWAESHLATVKQLRDLDEALGLPEELRPEAEQAADHIESVVRGVAERWGHSLPEAVVPS